MNLESIPITGLDVLNDTACLQVDTPLGALTEFYQAFNQQDFNQMATNWLNADSAVMANPLGGIRRGWEDIREVYERIFTGKANVYVEFFDYSITESKGFFQAIGRERGHVKIDQQTLDLSIRTSRLFVWHGSRYCQLHHHGSIDQSSMFNDYQRIIQSAQ